MSANPALQGSVQRVLPWVVGAIVVTAVFSPALPVLVKVVGTAGVMTAAIWFSRRISGVPDHAELALERHREEQEMLDAALRGIGPGHVLHLRSGEGGDAALEGMLEEALGDHGVSVLGVDSRAPSTNGPRLSRRFDWHQAVPRLMERARIIVLTPCEREGLGWELSALKARGLLDRTVLRMPPSADHPDAARRWEAARQSLLGEGVHLPPYNPSGRWFALSPTGGAPRDGGPYTYGIELDDLLMRLVGGTLPAPRLVAPVDTLGWAA
jgi:hypothetical protein